MEEFIQDRKKKKILSVWRGPGACFGSVLAIVTSRDRSRSVGWAILHVILSWFYVLHYVLTRKE